MENPEKNARWHERHSEMEKNRKEFLQWVKDTYNPLKVYYAGSGWDKLPREILGEDVIVHLSLEETRGQQSQHGYFPKLGSGHKVEGNFLQSPFRKESFDAVYIHNTPPGITIEAFPEFLRVLKEGGILLIDIENAIWHEDALHDFLNKALKVLHQEQLPVQLDKVSKRGLKDFGLFWNGIDAQFFAILKKQKRTT